jgi:hypothetical protein
VRGSVLLCRVRVVTFRGASSLCVSFLLCRIHSKLCAKGGGAIQKVLTMAESLQQMAERCFSAGATLRPHFDIPPHEALPGAFSLGRSVIQLHHVLYATVHGDATDARGGARARATGCDGETAASTETLLEDPSGASDNASEAAYEASVQVLDELLAAVSATETATHRAESNLDAAASVSSHAVGTRRMPTLSCLQRLS